MAELKSFQLIPSADSGFDIDVSKRLIDGIRALSKVESQLIIDNQATPNYLRFILRVDPKIEPRLLNKLISDIDPQIELIKIKYDEHYPVQNKYYLAKHFAYSLFLAESEDGLACLISSIHQSKTDKVRLVLDIKPKEPKRARYLRTRLINGHSPKLYTNNGIDIAKKITWLSFSALAKALTVLKNLTEENSRTRQFSNYLPVTEDKSIKLLDKLYDKLWKTNLSFEIKSKSQKQIKLFESQIDLALESISQKSDQKLNKKPRLANNIFSSSELSALFHIPSKIKDANIFDVSKLKTLQPVPELMTPNKGSLILGENIHGQQRSNIYLHSESRTKHLVILGATGSGKSTLIANMIHQDIGNKSAFTLIDPHGDLASEIHMMNQANDKVIYFDPSDPKYALGLNLLEISSPRDSPSYQLELDLVVEGVVSLFRKLFSDDGDSGGHRVEYLIRNSVYTALSVRNCTIFTVYRILTDPTFRDKVISKLKNQDLINFWKQELGKAGDFQRVKMSAGVTTKIGRLLYSSSARRFFGQPKSSINFDDLLSNGKSLICNFSKGTLGEETSKLFGISVLTKLQIAALKRSSIPPYLRRPHYLYIDEFQTFATPAVTQMLSEARKYKMYLTITNQSLSQLDSKLASIILSNVGNLICFRDSSPSDESTLLPLFAPYLNQGDILNLPAYNFYFKSLAGDSLAPTSGHILDLKAHQDLPKTSKKRPSQTYKLSLKLKPLT